MGVCLPAHINHANSTKPSTSHMVQGAKRPVHRRSHKASRHTKYRHAVAHKGATWKTGINATARLDLIQQSVRQDGFSGKVGELVSGSIRPGTARLYDVKWKAFCVWCDERRIVASEVSTPVVADFLTSLGELAPSTVADYRSAIAETLRHLRGIDIVSDPFIRGILRNHRLAMPLVQNKVPPWDLAVVLRYLSGAPFEPRKGVRFQMSHTKLYSCWRWRQARGGVNSMH